jgi:hypothetical protein
MIWSVEVVEISAENYLLTAIFGIISTESWPLALKVTLEIICFFLALKAKMWPKIWHFMHEKLFAVTRKKSVESCLLNNHGKVTT